MESTTPTYPARRNRPDFESSYNAAWSSLVLVTATNSAALAPHIENVCMATIEHVENMNEEHEALISEFEAYKKRNPEAKQ